jgi:eukaryotic-like serine/threonine-protein kinase
MIGETISHYKIIEKLGEGGMGVVYKAEDTMLHRTVALKFPSDSFYRDEGARTRLLNEARLAARLLHQNVTVIHGVGEHDGQPYIVMEYVDGITLRRIIDRGEPLSIGRIILIAIQLCEGLRAVHEKMVMHRDIKSENILINDNDLVKIADCGLAARFISAEGMEEKLGLAGTTAYMSPEQAMGKPMDQRSDIFSAGVVLYEMIAGRLPFVAKQRDALLYLIMNADPDPLETIRPDVPAMLSAVVTRALEKEPAKRYPDAGSMLGDLRRVQHSATTSLGSPTA